MARRNQTAEAPKTVAGIEMQTTNAVGKRIDGIAQTVKTLDSEVHQTAIQCLIHASLHGDATLMKRLILEALPEKSGYRRQGLIQWMNDHSPIRIVGKELKESGKDEAGNKLPYRIEEANKTPFWDYAPSNETLRPVYAQDLAKGVMDTASRFDKLLQNTNLKTGEPLDPTKPFFKGNATEMLRWVNGIKALGMPNDTTKLDDAKAKLEARVNERPEVAPVVDEPAGAPVVAEEEHKAA